MRIVLFFYFLCCSLIASGKTLRVAAPASEGHLSQHYFVSLLQLIAQKSNVLNPQKAAIHIEVVAVQEAAIREDILLQRGFLDVMWAGSNDELEARLLPVKVPVVGGLLGYRIALVRKTKLDWFNQLTVAEIKQLDACQGEFWTDSDILEANGFHVKRAKSYDALPRMLIQGRCDYFPRGLHEAPTELKNLGHQYPELTIAYKRILKYHLAAFMFLNQGQDALAQRLESAFKHAIEDGSVHTLRSQSALFKPIFPLQKWHNSQFIELDNPFFSTGERQEIPSLYWLNIENPVLVKN